MSALPPDFPYGTASSVRHPETGVEGAASPDLVRSTTFARRRASTLRDLGLRRSHEDFYSRYGHPNARAVESTIARLEHGEGAVSFASGMAAVHAVFASLAGVGDVVAVAHQVYGGVSKLAQVELARRGVEVCVFDVFDPSAVEAVLERRPRLCWVETPINPTLRLVDLKSVSARCRAAGVLLACDATFAPAPIQRVLDHGVDLAVHSLTKFYGGHSDVLGGVVVGRHEHCALVEGFRALTGAVLAPDSAWLVQRSLATHTVRVVEQNRRALELAKWLSSHVTEDGPLRAVHHPGLRSHPDHRLAKKQMEGGFGAVLTVSVGGGLKKAVQAYERLRVVARAPSLGGVESLASLPVDSSHTGLDAAGLRMHGIDKGMIRLSIGLEPIDELRLDLAQALRIDGAAR